MSYSVWLVPLKNYQSIFFQRYQLYAVTHFCCWDVKQPNIKNTKRTTRTDWLETLLLNFFEVLKNPWDAFLKMLSEMFNSLYWKSYDKLFRVYCFFLSVLSSIVRSSSICFRIRSILLWKLSSSPAGLATFIPLSAIAGRSECRRFAAGNSFFRKIEQVVIFLMWRIRNFWRLRWTREDLTFLTMLSKMFNSFYWTIYDKLFRVYCFFLSVLSSIVRSSSICFRIRSILLWKLSSSPAGLATFIPLSAIAGRSECRRFAAVFSVDGLREGTLRPSQLWVGLTVLLEWPSHIHMNNSSNYY